MTASTGSGSCGQLLASPGAVDQAGGSRVGVAPAGAAAGVGQLRGAAGRCLWPGGAHQGHGHPGPQTAAGHGHPHCRHSGQEKPQEEGRCDFSVQTGGGGGGGVQGHIH